MTGSNCRKSQPCAASDSRVTHAVVQLCRGASELLPGHRSKRLQRFNPLQLLLFGVVPRKSRGFHWTQSVRFFFKSIVSQLHNWDVLGRTHLLTGMCILMVSFMPQTATAGVKTEEFQTLPPPLPMLRNWKLLTPHTPRNGKVTKRNQSKSQVKGHFQNLVQVRIFFRHLELTVLLLAAYHWSRE